MLKKADKTFECVHENGYCAANAEQFMVDLVIAPRGMQAAKKITFSESDFFLVSDGQDLSTTELVSA